jgi:heptosyltransferase III
LNPNSRLSAADGRLPSDPKANSLLPSLPPRSRILFVRLRSIGDIILLTPALAMLKAWRPDLVLSVLVNGGFRQLLAGNPDVDEILVLDSPRLVVGVRSNRKLDGRRRAAVLFRLVMQIRRRRFALCLNLHGGPTSAWLTAFSSARWKAGFHHFRWPRLYHYLVPDARRILGQETVHTAELQAAALCWLGLPPATIPPAKMIVNSGCREVWHANRPKLGLPAGQDYAVIHPTALYATKQWPPEKFAEIGALLERETKLAVLYACGPGEFTVLDAVEGAAGHRLRRLQDVSLDLYAAALSEARLFIGNDSGPAHMASALGRPVVVIFGSSSSRIWGPWPQPGSRGATPAGVLSAIQSSVPSPASHLNATTPLRPARVVQNFYECNPCPGDRCYRFERPECILSISVAQVWDAVRAVLSELGGEP